MLCPPLAVLLMQDKDRQQFVMTYALTDWEKWKLHVREEDCLLPHRPEQASAHLAAGPSAAAVDERMTQDDEGADQERAPAPPKGRSKGGTKRVQKQLPVEVSPFSMGASRMDAPDSLALQLLEQGSVLCPDPRPFLCRRTRMRTRMKTKKKTKKKTVMRR